MKNINDRLMGSALLSASPIPYAVLNHDFRKDRLGYAGGHYKTIVGLDADGNTITERAWFDNKGGLLSVNAYSEILSIEKEKH